MHCNFCTNSITALTKSSKIKAPPGCRVLYGDSSDKGSLSSVMHKFMEGKGNDHGTIFVR